MATCVCSKTIALEFVLTWFDKNKEKNIQRNGEKKKNWTKQMQKEKSNKRWHLWCSELS